MHFKSRFVRSFRYRMILLFGLSMLYSGGCTFLVYKVLQFYYHTVRRESPLYQLRTFIRSIGDVNFFLIVFIPLAVIFFLLLTKPYPVYFREISQGIRQLAEGRFNSRVEIPEGDEFGDIARDINQAGANLQHALERGDFAENSKEQLVLNLAHDLRTPLTSVIGYLDILLKDDGLSAEQVKHFTGIAHTKSLKLEKLIDQLFEITRLNYGKLPIQQQAVDLGELLVQLSEELYPVLEKHNLVSRLHISERLTVQGDGDLLARVFENLLNNAVRHGMDGQYVDVFGKLEEREAVVQVVNYGDCIPAEELPHLFDMFFTGDRARSNQEGGTGLGLFIAKNIVERHQGVISAQSGPARTVFEVRLPVSVPMVSD